MDPHWVFLFLVFATVFSFGQAAWGLVGVGRTKAAVNKRLATAERTGSLRELVLELRQQGGFHEGGGSIFSWAWLGDLIMRSGITVDVRRWTLAIAGVALGGGAAAFYFSHSPFIALGAAVLAATAGPFGYL